MLSFIRSLHIQHKITLLTVVILLITISLYTGLKIAADNQLVKNQETERLKDLWAAFQERMTSKQSEAAALASAVAELPSVQEAFAQQDRQALADLLVPVYKQLSQEHGVSQAQFHLPPAISFLRLNKLDKFGDDLSAFRHTVVAANTSLQPIAGLEEGVTGYGFRGVIPVRYQDKAVGTFEFGMDFNQAFLDEFKNAFGADISIWIDPEQTMLEDLADRKKQGGYVLYASTLENPLLLPAALRQQVFQSGKPAFTDAALDGQNYMVAISPVRDFSGKVIALAELAESRDEALQQTASSRNTSLIIGLGLILLGGLASWMISGALARPIQRLAQAMSGIASHDLPALRDALSQLSQGNLASQIQFEAQTQVYPARDEIGQMTQAYNTIVAELKDCEPSYQATQQGLHRLVMAVTDQAQQVSSDSRSVASSAGQTLSAAQQVAATLVQLSQGANQQAQSVNSTVMSVEQMTRSIDGVAQGAREQANSVALASQTMNELSRSVDTIRREAEAQSAQINQAEAARQSLSQDLKNATLETEQVTVQAQQAASAAIQGVELAKQISQNMDQVSQASSLLAQRVGDLGKRSAQIGAIVQTIDEIASQTNLLSLNAAIEAARAGTHGRGFAVVADEVRKLAERSASAAKEVSEMIRLIQNDASEAVQAMEQTGKNVHTATTFTHQASQAFQAIASGASASSDRAASIRQAIQKMNDSASKMEKAIVQSGQIADQNRLSAVQMNDLSNRMVENLDSVSAVVEENTSATLEMADSSLQVRKEIENIASVSEENSAAIEQVNASTQEMNRQMEQVLQLTHSLAETAADLQQMLGRFQLS